MRGHLHPLTQFIRKTVKVFEKLGFEIVEGPEIETEWYNFDSLRMFADHPARDVQDTFWLKDGRLLRTHTTSLQVRTMEKRKPPVRILVPGRCFRHEATDASHETNFYQVDGFAIERSIRMSDLIGTLDYFVKEIFGKDIKIRIRPSYFPFVEPGMEMDIGLKRGWEEILGAGMIHPDVLKNMGLDPKKWSGFAFGIGLDRLMMLYFGVLDIRLSYSGDLKFLKQF